MKIIRWLRRVVVGFAIAALATAIISPDSLANSPEATMTTLTTSLNPSVYGQAVTFTALVTASSGKPTGKVTFQDGSVPIGTVTLVGGTASLTRATLAAGTGSITAVYRGSANFAGSTSSALSQVVTSATSSVTLVSSQNPSAVAEMVTFTATVAPEFSETPTGTVTFKNGTTTLRRVTLANGVATYATATLGVGAASITAAYGGSPSFSGSTSPVLKQQVTVASSSVTLISSLNPSIFGQPVAFTAMVSSQSGTPTGLVAFYDGDLWMGDAWLNGGAATFTTTAVGVGTGSIKAVYIGSGTIAGSTSSAISQVVNPATSSVTLTSSLNPSSIGQFVTFSATVVPEFSGIPTGTVTFMNGSTVMGTEPLSGGAAALTTTSLGSGSLGITANYVPTDGFSASTGTLTQTVDLSGTPNYELGAAPLIPGSVTAGHTATSVITLTPANTYAGTVNLSCGVSGGLDPAPTCSFNPSSVSVNGMSTATSILTVATTSGSPASSYTISVTGIDTNALAPVNGPQTLALNTATVIEHVVIIFQENRTPDNLFQDPVLIARGADIASSGLNSHGQTIPLSPIDLGTTGSIPDPYDLNHNNASFVLMYDGGKMDGADLISCSPAADCPPNANPNPQFRYVMASDVQPYFAMAEQYTFADRMFQTNEGPSFPAHQFILSGTSAPTANSPLFAAGNGAAQSNGIVEGCLAPVGTTVQMIDASGSVTVPAQEYPCFEHPTLTDLLDANGLTWHYYTYGDSSLWTAPNAIEHLCQAQTVLGKLTCESPAWIGNVVIPQTQVLSDIANGQLAQVSWIIPGGLSSDHSGTNDGSGPSWVASIVNAIGNSPYWANTAIIITWDDWGGWYDHVAPKVINDGVSWGSGFVYGFRVPLIVVSPYAKAAYISHTTHDFGSVLKFVESNFNLPSLGYADAYADDLSDCFDLTQSPLTFGTIPAPLGAQYFLNDKRPPTPPDVD